MQRSIYLIMAVAAIIFITPVHAQVDDEEDAYDTKVPPGMVLQQIGNKPSVTAVVPEGTSVRRTGDLRILEGSGEYAARKFVKYDAIIEQMQTDIESLRKDVDDLKNAVSAMQKAKLVSK